MTAAPRISIPARAWTSFKAMAPEIAVFVALVKVVEGLPFTTPLLNDLVFALIRVLVFFIILRDMSQVLGGRPKESRFKQFVSLMVPILLAHVVLQWIFLSIPAHPVAQVLIPVMALILILAVAGPYLSAIIVRQKDRGAMPAARDILRATLLMTAFWFAMRIAVFLMALGAGVLSSQVQALTGQGEVVVWTWSVVFTAMAFFVDALFAGVIWSGWVRNNPEFER